MCTQRASAKGHQVKITLYMMITPVVTCVVTCRRKPYQSLLQSTLAPVPLLRHQKTHSYKPCDLCFLQTSVPTNPLFYISYRKQGNGIPPRNWDDNVLVHARGATSAPVTPVGNTSTPPRKCCIQTTYKKPKFCVCNTYAKPGEGRVPPWLSNPAGRAKGEVTNWWFFGRTVN